MRRRQAVPGDSTRRRLSPALSTTYQRTVRLSSGPILSKLDRRACHEYFSASSRSLGTPSNSVSDRSEIGFRHSRKEVIQPQILLQLPCYDFTPITDHTLGACPPCGLAQRLLVQPAFVM